MVKSPNHRMHHINSWNSSNLPAYRKQKSHPVRMGFCFAVSFYFSSTTLYCAYYQYFVWFQLLLLPQRYEFSSKSQLASGGKDNKFGCCCYRKGTNFQANHNISWITISPSLLLLLPQRYEFSSKSQHPNSTHCKYLVVVATAKVRIFKQITTLQELVSLQVSLLLLPQRYEFSSKSQLNIMGGEWFSGCCCYRKGTNFQANHNQSARCCLWWAVVVATAKVRIFKQITTVLFWLTMVTLLLLLPQRYEFSSKSQHRCVLRLATKCCCCYRKGTNFQANHNSAPPLTASCWVVVATAKVRIFKQITTTQQQGGGNALLLLLPQRYEFSSKSQRDLPWWVYLNVVVATAKVRIFKQITTSSSTTFRG